MKLAIVFLTLQVKLYLLHLAHMTINYDYKSQL